MKNALGNLVKKVYEEYIENNWFMLTARILYTIGFLVTSYLLIFIIPPALLLLTISVLGFIIFFMWTVAKIIDYKATL